MKRKNYGLLAYILVCIIWGSTYLAIRIGVKSMPPFLFAGIRNVTAGSIILLFSYIRKLEFPNGLEEYGKISIVGFFLLGICNTLVVIAEMRINSSTAALLLALIPIFIVIIEQFIPGGSRISLMGWFGMFIGFAGVGILSFSGGSEFDMNIFGIVLLFLSCLSWATGSVYSKRTVFTGSIVTQIGIQMFAGGILQVLMGLFAGEVSKFKYSPSGFGAMLYLIFMGSLIGYTSYIYLISVWPISKAGTYAYVNPVVAMFLGWFILHEAVTVKMIVSAVLILVGVLIVQKSKITEKAEEIIEEVIDT
ncbi:MAG: EamA family transporter [Clostridiales bacterium]|nr:EamA family transporter [Clostridiales bacterium]